MINKVQPQISFTQLKLEKSGQTERVLAKFANTPKLKKATNEMLDRLDKASGDNRITLYARIRDEWTDSLQEPPVTHPKRFVLDLRSRLFKHLPYKVIEANASTKDKIKALEEIAGQTEKKIAGVEIPIAGWDKYR